MGVSMFDEMKDYVGFNKDDVEALTSLRDSKDLNIPQIVSEFYDKVERNDTTRSIVEQHSSRAKLERTLHQWIVDLLSGLYDGDYYIRRLKIGVVHVNIGLPAHFVFTAMNLIRKGLSMVANADQKVAIDKLMDVELGIINQAYWEDLTNKIVRKERLTTIGELTASLAHEVRTPLAAVRNAAYFVRVASENPSAKVEKHLDIIDTKIQECSDLVRSVLAFAQTGDRQQETVDLLDILRCALDDVAVPKAATLTIHNDAKHYLITANRSQMRGLLRNLILNAVQATHGKGSIAIDISSDDSHVLLTVSDDGLGIPSSVATTLFEPLTTTKTSGLGLGLSYCSRVALSHDGTLSVSENKEGGATFSLELKHDRS